MLRTLTTRIVLACYSVIALFGQGLHVWMEHGDCHSDSSIEAVAGFDGPQAADQRILDAPDSCCQHDPDHCVICQHHSLGQIFVAAPPVEMVLAACELLSPHAPDAVVCTAYFSPAQPRAPPSVS